MACHQHLSGNPYNTETGAKQCSQKVSELLEVIEVQLQSCSRTGAQVFYPAPNDIWERYRCKSAKKIPGELMSRIIRDANKRFCHDLPAFDTVRASEDIPQERFEMA